jgi:hypothetical protein
MKKSLLRKAMYSLAVSLLVFGMANWLAGCSDNIVKQESIPPSQPTNLTVTHVDSTTVDLTWTASTDNICVASYNVYRGDGEGTILAGNTPVNSFHDAGLIPSMTYIYTIEALDCSDNVSTRSAPDTIVTSENLPDDTPPTVLFTIPIDGDTVDGTIGVILINATFSEPMLPSSINSESFTIESNIESMVAEVASPVAGVVSYDVVNRRASFVPTDDLPLATEFTATITTMAEDISGNSLATNYVWHFSTFTYQSEQLPVNLLSCSGFAVLGGSTITNTGPTHITGDVGLSPGSAVVGFPPGIITGTLHVNDPAAAQAKLDLTTAYNDAAGQTLNPVTLSGNIGGMTLAPGLYKSTSTLEISSGDLTLDGGGNANAVWIFQIASTFTTTVGRAVVLSGSANANNIFWQVGTSATLGVNSIFKGTILCDQSITMNTGATLEGRVLTRIAAVTLDNNTIVKPLP